MRTVVVGEGAVTQQSCEQTQRGATAHRCSARPECQRDTTATWRRNSARTRSAYKADTTAVIGFPR